MGGGLKGGAADQAFHARDPHIPSQAILNSLEQPSVSTAMRFLLRIHCNCNRIDPRRVKGEGRGVEQMRW
jgi:predicted transcriptional regulator